MHTSMWIGFGIISRLLLSKLLFFSFVLINYYHTLLLDNERASLFKPSDPYFLICDYLFFGTVIVSYITFTNLLISVHALLELPFLYGLLIPLCILDFS